MPLSNTGTSPAATVPAVTGTPALPAAGASAAAADALGRMISGSSPAVATTTPAATTSVTTATFRIRAPPLSNRQTPIIDLGYHLHPRRRRSPPDSIGLRHPAASAAGVGR